MPNVNWFHYPEEPYEPVVVDVAAVLDLAVERFSGLTMLTITPEMLAELSAGLLFLETAFSARRF